MAFWKRWSRSSRNAGERLPVNEFMDYNGGWNATSMPASLEPTLNESKTRVYDDELDEDWRDPITEVDSDEDDE